MAGAAHDDVKSFVIDIQQLMYFARWLESGGIRTRTEATPSFSNAERCEQLIEHALVVHLAGDLAERPERSAEIACKKLGGPGALYLHERFLEAGAGLREKMGVPDVDRYPFLSDRRLYPVGEAGHLLKKRPESGAVERAYRDGREPGRRDGRRRPPFGQEIGLVEHDDGIQLIDTYRKRGGKGRGGARRVEDEEEEVGAVRAFQGLLDPEHLDSRCARAEARGVDQDEAVRPDAHALLDEVPGGARLGADDRPFAADEPVEKGALPGVGLAQDDRPDPLPQQRARALGREQELRPAENGRNALPKPDAVLGGQVLVGKIDVGLDRGQGAKEAVDKLRHVPPERTAKQLAGGGERPLAARAYQVHDRLCLAEVHPAV